MEIKKIHKYLIKVAGQQILELPANAKILVLREQKNYPCLWAEFPFRVPIEERKEKRTILMFATGDDIEDAGNLTYLGTIFLYGGDEVYHYYEKLNSKV